MLGVGKSSNKQPAPAPPEDKTIPALSEELRVGPVVLKSNREPLPEGVRDTALRHAALKLAVAAHQGRVPQDISAAAENYYQFLKGGKPSSPDCETDKQMQQQEAGQ